jgi:hypothetical protein
MCRGLTASEKATYNCSARRRFRLDRSRHHRRLATCRRTRRTTSWSHQTRNQILPGVSGPFIAAIVPWLMPTRKTGTGDWSWAKAADRPPANHIPGSFARPAGSFH